MDRKEWLEELDEAGARLSQAAWELNHIDELCTYPESGEAVRLRFLDAVADVFLCCCELQVPIKSETFTKLMAIKWRVKHGQD